ncbi:hypothetical protein BABINDRAFT_160944, partial [Babjeviella inositovora NRRL Y-12698]
CIRSLAIDCADVVDFRISPANTGHCLLFHASGTISIVNWKDKNAPQAIIATTTTDLPVLSVVSLTAEAVVLITGKNGKHTPHTRTLVLLDLETQQHAELVAIKNVLRFAVSADASRIAFVTSTNEVITVDSTGMILETSAFAFRSPVSALAVSNAGLVALGTASGAIQVLHTTQRLLKWHIDRVAALRFSADGNYLLSGGAERVLVFWQLETDKTQFLPRLNGSIEDIQVTNEYYSLMLNVGESHPELEYLVLSVVDLASRLSVSGIRPNFASPPASLEKLKKRLGKQSAPLLDVSKIKYDFTAAFEIHPVSKLAYFPSGPQIQVYDMLKSEQSFVQTAANTSQAGKVRSENKLLDPQVELLAFTQCGTWMCTFDRLPTPEIDSLMSRDDVQYSLKFWKYVDVKHGHWELCTKVVAPHGAAPVAALIPAPALYHGGVAFLTADNKGGVRLWRPRVPKEIYQKAAVVTAGEKLQQTAWTLRKTKPSGVLVSTAVALAWSEDASLIVLAHEAAMLPIDVTTFRDLPQLPSLTGSRIRGLEIVDHHLVALSKTRLVAYDLLSAQQSPLVCKISTPTGGRNLLAVDAKHRLVAVAVNYHTKSFDVKSKVYVFRPDSLQPVHVAEHDQAIASIRYVARSNAFVFVDVDARMGSLSSASATLFSALEMASASAAQDFATEISVLLQSAQATANIVNGVARMDIDEDMAVTRVINANSFDAAFENLDGVSMENLFDRIIKAIN